MEVSPELIEHLKEASGCYEMYEVYKARGHRRDKQGRDTKIEFNIYDGGDFLAARFFVSAQDDFGRRVTGGPYHDLYTAISKVNWAELDSDVPA